MPAKSEALTPPWSTVRPSTNDSGMPSRTEPSTIACGDPSACEPVGSFRADPPRRASNQSPRVNTPAPARTKVATHTTSLDAIASSTNSKETEPISTPVPTAITTAIRARLGRQR